MADILAGYGINVRHSEYEWIMNNLEAVEDQAKLQTIALSMDPYSHLWSAFIEHCSYLPRKELPDQR